MTQNLGCHKFKEVREVEKRGWLTDGTGHRMVSTENRKCPLEHDKCDITAVGTVGKMSVILVQLRVNYCFRAADKNTT